MGVLARKLARARGALAGPVDDLPEPDFGSAGFAGMAAPDAPDPVLRAWRLALARAARDQLKMTVGFSNIAGAQSSLTEVLETPMQRALILMLQGPGDAMGLMVLSGPMLAAMIEMLTLTRLAPTGPDEADLRKPTRTDAAMAVEFVDAALAGLEGGLTEADGAAWAKGYRYAAFIDDPRPLHLMLEDGEFHLLTTDLALEDGTRTGQVTLALPEGAAADFGAGLAGAGQLGAGLAGAGIGGFDLGLDLSSQGDDSAAQDMDFQIELAAQVQDLPAQVDAALSHITLPLERVLRLQVGEVLPLVGASLDAIGLYGLDGRRVAGARLGQNRGMRALRLTDVPSLGTVNRALDAAPANTARAFNPSAAEHGQAATQDAAQMTRETATMPDDAMGAAGYDLPALQSA